MWYLCVMLEGKPYYNAGNGQWSTERSHRECMTKAQAQQRADASIFRETITLHEDDSNATEEQPSQNRSHAN